MAAWPNGRLNRINDTANYTCSSTGNSAGPGVSNTIQFFVECKSITFLIPTYVLSLVLIKGSCYQFTAFQFQTKEFLTFEIINRQSLSIEFLLKSLNLAVYLALLSQKS